MTENADKTSDASRRQFLKIGAGVVGGLIVGAAAVYVAKPSTTSTVTCTVTATSTLPGSTVTSVSTVTSTLSGPAVTSTETTTDTVTCTTASSSAQAQITALQVQLDTVTGFLALSADEQACLTAIADTIIPTDSSGPGAAQAGVVYFIDRQLATDYGKSGNMYTQEPFIPTGITTPITLNNVTYSAGTFAPGAGGGYSWQYALNLREFWRVSIDAFETYCNSAYGADFETLSAANQVQALTDLWNNKPTNFSEIVPSDFAWELFYMVWAGFLTDPLYGGNRNMVGWQLVAFNGTNTGNFYGEGHTAIELAVATTPTRLQPASLAQYQKGSP